MTVFIPRVESTFLIQVHLVCKHLVKNRLDFCVVLTS